MTRRAMPPTTEALRRSGPRRVARLALLAFAASLSPVLALPIEEGKLVTFEVRGEKVQAHHVRPAAAGFHAGVVIIHEWWGLNGQIKGVAERLAGEGYVVIVPDLFRGKLGTDAGWAYQLERELNESWAVDVIGAAADWLRTTASRVAGRPRGQKMPVATLGFGMGGKLSLAAALEGKEIQAAVIFYGSVESGMEALRSLSVPLLGIFADEDHDIPREQVKAFETALKGAGKDATIIIYRGVGHSFFNETRPNYEKSGAKIAWERTVEFLKEKIGAPAVAGPKGQNPPPPTPPARDLKEPSGG